MFNWCLEIRRLAGSNQNAHPAKIKNEDRKIRLIPIRFEAEHNKSLPSKAFSGSILLTFISFWYKALNTMNL